jgi:hypothetical protein
VLQNDLPFRKATALHALVLVMGQSELQPGLSRGATSKDIDEVLKQASPRPLETGFSAEESQSHFGDVSRFAARRIFPNTTQAALARRE